MVDEIKNNDNANANTIKTKETTTTTTHTSEMHITMRDGPVASISTRNEIQSKSESFEIEIPLECAPEPDEYEIHTEHGSIPVALGQEFIDIPLTEDDNEGCVLTPFAEPLTSEESDTPSLYASLLETFYDDYLNPSKLTLICLVIFSILAFFPSLDSEKCAAESGEDFALIPPWAWVTLLTLNLSGTAGFLGNYFLYIASLKNFVKFTKEGKLKNAFSPSKVGLKTAIANWGTALSAFVSATSIGGANYSAKESLYPKLRLDIAFAGTTLANIPLHLMAMINLNDKALMPSEVAIFQRAIMKCHDKFALMSAEKQRDILFSVLKWMKQEHTQLSVIQAAQKLEIILAIQAPDECIHQAYTFLNSLDEFSLLQLSITLMHVTGIQPEGKIKHAILMIANAIAASIGTVACLVGCPYAIYLGTYGILNTFSSILPFYVNDTLVKSTAGAIVTYGMLSKIALYINGQMNLIPMIERIINLQYLCELFQRPKSHWIPLALAGASSSIILGWGGLCYGDDVSTQLDVMTEQLAEWGLEITIPEILENLLVLIGIAGAAAVNFKGYVEVLFPLTTWVTEKIDFTMKKIIKGTDQHPRMINGKSDLSALITQVAKRLNTSHGIAIKQKIHSFLAHDKLDDVKNREVESLVDLRGPDYLSINKS